MTLSEELTWRGFVNQTTYPNLSALDTNTPVTFYWGVDPSADSMTIGNLAAAMMVKTFMKYGQRPVLLIGGATGLIGDPDGKSDERSLKTLAEIEANKQAIIAQYRQIFGKRSFELVDNYDWFKEMNYLDFLRDVGKNVPLRQMLGREFVQSRLGETGNGLSYAEFSYVLIQAYDFLRLYEDKGVTLQVCGADQWGNSIAGVDLIRRKTGGEAHVYSAPLLVNQTTGEKFGKSETGAIWLDERKTSVYQFYQFWFNIGDDQVEAYLKIFTELDPEAITKIMTDFRDHPGSRIAQKALAYEVTKLVHSQKRLDEIIKVTEVVFSGGNFQALGRKELEILRRELPFGQATPGDFPQTLVDARLASSKAEARTFLDSGAIFVNNQKAGPDNLDLLVKGYNLIRRGKNQFAVVER